MTPFEITRSPLGEIRISGCVRGTSATESTAAETAAAKARETLSLIARTHERIREIEVDSSRSESSEACRDLLRIGMEIRIHLANYSEPGLNSRADESDRAGRWHDEIRRRVHRPASLRREREFRSSVQIEIDRARLRHTARIRKIY